MSNRKSFATYANTTAFCSPRSQRGASSLGWLAIIFVAIIIGRCAFLLVPLYVENIYVRDALKSIQELESPEGGFESVANQTIRERLSDYFQMNSIRGNASKAVEIKRLKNKFIVSLNYEERVTLFANIDFVVHFENEFDSSRPYDCCIPASE